MENKKAVEVEDGFKVGSIATQTEEVIVYEGKVLSDREALTLILNKLERLEKGLL